MQFKTIALRLSRLKAKSIEEAGLLTYPIGALFCASEAQRCKFSDPIDHPDRWSVELNQALDAARKLGCGKRPPESTWLSIVHFNSALHRIDAGFERIIKHITGKRASKFNVLAPAALKAGVPKKTIEAWNKIRTQEVNRLKHQTGGALSGKRLSFQDMLKALDALVRLIEARL